MHRQLLVLVLVCCSRNNFSAILATLSLSFSARGTQVNAQRNFTQPRRTGRTEPPSTLGHHQPARRPSYPSDPAGSPRLFADRNRSFDRFLDPHDHLLVPAFSRLQLDGLLDKPGRGRKTSLPADAECRVLEQVAQPRIDEPRWSCRSMARVAGISATSVH